MASKKPSVANQGEQQRVFIGAMRQLSSNGRQRPFTVFRDFCELAAIAISNATDLAQREAREARYLDIVRDYEPEDVRLFPVMLGAVTEALTEGFGDVLGSLFMTQEFGDDSRGQFFTPYHVSSLLARINLQGVRATIEQKGFVTACEPACGAGGMLVAMAEAMRDEGINYQRCLHATAIDIDVTAVHMAFIQLSTVTR